MSIWAIVCLKSFFPQMFILRAHLNWNWLLPWFAEVAHDADSNSEKSRGMFHKFESSFLRSEMTTFSNKETFSIMQIVS
jgi:hypothetical protein